MAERIETDDPFAFIVKFCQPTASQEAYLRSCPFDRESEVFEDSEPFPWPSDSAPVQPAGIAWSTVPKSQNSVKQHAVFHTPPEHHPQSKLSPSEDQNLNDLRAGGARTVDLGKGKNILKTVRGFEGILDGEPESKKIRALGKEINDGKAVPVGRTEETVNGIIDLVSDDGDFDEETTSVNSKEGRAEVGVQKTSGLTKQQASIVDAVADILRVELSNEVDDQIENLKSLLSNMLGKVGVKVSGNEKISKDEVRKSASACRRIEEIDKFRFSGCNNVGRKLKARGPETQVPSKRKRELPASMKEMEKNDRGSSMKEMEKNEGGSDVVGKGDRKNDQMKKAKVKNDGGSNVAGKMETRSGQSESDRGSNLAGNAEAENGQSKEKEGGINVVGKVKKKGGLMDNLGILKTIFQNLDKDDGSEKDVDFIETAKNKGITFPRPRWWPPEGEET